MSSDADFLDITLLGKEYRVACPQEEKDALSRAVAYLDGKMREITGKTRSNDAERVAVMAALNIAHELLSGKASTQDSSDETGLDIDTVKRRISLMETQLDTLLELQDKPN